MASNVEEYHLNPSMVLYAVARAEGLNKLESAKRGNVSEQCIYKWLADPVKGPAINAEVDRLLDAHVSEIRRDFRSAARRAKERIVECMEPGYLLGNQAAVNLRAAELVLKFAEMEPATKTDTNLTGSLLTVIRKEFV